MKNWLKKIGNNIKTFFQKAGKKVASFSKKIWGKVVDVAKKVWAKISPFLLKIWRPVAPFFHKVWKGIKVAFKAVANFFKGIVRRIPRALRLPVAFILCFVLQLGVLLATAPPSLNPVSAYYVLCYSNSAGGRVFGKTFQEIKPYSTGEKVTAVADEGYAFVRWSDGVTTPTRQDEDIDYHLSVYPIFEPAEYSVRYEGKIDGHVFYQEAKYETREDTVSFTAKEILGYKFVSWSDGVTTPSRTDGYDARYKTLTANYEIDSLDTPIVSIVTTDELPIESKETYLGCTVSVSNTNSTYCFEDTTAQIKGRGHNSWTSPKKPYKLKFDVAQSMFGTAYEAREWTLVGSHLDKTLSRNALALEFASTLEDTAFSSIHQFVELYVNYEYLGVFLLCDQVQTGEGRVDVDQTYASDGNNGYLIELDGYAQSEGVLDEDYFFLNGYTYTIKSPDTDDPAYDPTVQRKYIQDYMNDALNALRRKDWTTAVSMIDADSFVDAYIAMLLFVPVDCCSDNVYFYKDKDGKLFAGPVWDFDLGSGNVNYVKEFSDEETCRPDKSLYVPEVNPWYQALNSNVEFKSLVAEKLRRYESNVQRILDLASPVRSNVGSQTQGYYSLYYQAIMRNDQKWKVLSNNNNYEPNDLALITTAEGHFEYLQDWLTDRYAYLLAQYPVQ